MVPLRRIMSYLILDSAASPNLPQAIVSKIPVLTIFALFLAHRRKVSWLPFLEYVFVLRVASD